MKLLDQVKNEAESQELQADWDDEGPRCSQELCVQYDGNRCRVLGRRPSAMCEPAIKILVTRAALVVGILALACLSACAPRHETRFEPYCETPEERAAAAKFVVDCATAANPKSDEEGEDLVAQCEVTANHLLCSNKTIHYLCSDGNCREVKP